MAINIFRKSEHIYWIWLAEKLNNHNAVFQRLLDLFHNSPYDVYSASENTLSGLDFLTQAQKRVLSDKNLDEALTIHSFCKKNGIGLLCYGDPAYPQSLKAIKKPPMVLYYLGKLPDFNNRIFVSVVGTREMTEYGMRSCYKIAYELASAGAVVVSGMALGIDSIAHAGAIGARGTTVAVLGCGIDVIYPKQHRNLRKLIMENGVIMSAYAPGTPAYKTNFPERNAIISGLSEGTLVVEAPMRSGSLITAEYASEQSRSVYALPGSIEEPMSEGTNNLIKHGAVAITCARDILNYYFENKSPLVSSVKLKHGELSSEFEQDVLLEAGISATCHGRGPKGTPASLLKKLNDSLINNAEQNSDYYAIPEIKRIGESTTEEKQPLKIKTAKDIKEKSVPTPVSESVLASLTEEQRRIFDELPCDKPVSVDTLSKSGYNIGTLMASLTVLEIKGLISSLPGGMYIRK